MNSFFLKKWNIYSPFKWNKQRIGFWVSIAFFMSQNVMVSGQSNKVDSLTRILENKSINDTTHVRVLVQLAQEYIYSDANKAAKYGEEAVRIALATDHDKTKADAYKNLGNVNFYLSNYNLAVEYWLQSLNYAEKTGDQLFMASLYGNLGAAQNELKQHEKGIFYLKKKLEILNTTPNVQEEIFTYINLSSSYLALGNNDSSFFYNDLGLLKSQESENSFTKAHLNSLRSTGYTNLGEYDKALEYAFQVEQYAELSGNKDLNALTTNQMSLIYSKLGLFDKAYEYSQKAYLLANEFGSKKWQMEVFEYRSLIDQEQGNYKDALSNYTRYIQIRDSIIGDENQVENARLEERFEAEKNYEIMRAELDYQRKIQIFLLANMVVIILIGIAVWLLFQKKRKAQMAQKNEMFKSFVAETNLKLYRLQMNPHFIFNSLNSISDYIRRNQINDAEFYLRKFASLMRGTLENSLENYITLKEDLQVLESYIELEKARLDNSFKFWVEVSKDLDPDLVLIPPMILQPFIENAIWHGLSEKRDGGQIKLSIERNKENLVCTIQDNGKGWSEIEPKGEKKSYGVRLTKERLEIISRMTNISTGLFFSDNLPGTKVKMELPYILDES